MGRTRKGPQGAPRGPSLAKGMLTSPATDLGLPSSEQGAGLLNTYKAVQLAESIKTTAGAPTPTGDTLLFSRGQLTATGWPGSKKSWQIRVTNTGAQGKLVTAPGRSFGPDQGIETGSGYLAEATSQTFADAGTLPTNYTPFRVTVLPSANR